MNDNIIDFNKNNKDKEDDIKQAKFQKLAEFLYDNEITPMDLEEFIFENEANTILEFYESIEIEEAEERVYKLMDIIAEYAGEIGEILIDKAMFISHEYMVPPSQIIMLAANMLVSNLFKEEMQVGEEILANMESDDEESQLEFDFFLDENEDGGID